MRAEDQSAFAEIVSARLPGLRRFALAVCGDWHRADDLVQDTLVRLYVAWPLRDERAIDAWLRTAMLRQWTDHTRRAWWRREQSTQLVPDDAKEAPDGSDAVAVLHLLQRVTPKQRACLVLRFLEDRSVEETARILNLSPGTVKSQTSRALEAIRRIEQAQESVHPAGKREP